MVVWKHLQQANAQARFANPVQPMMAFDQTSSHNASKQKKKRQTSGEHGSPAVDRAIQPQLPLNFAPVNSPSNPATEQGLPASAVGGPLKKKRGRPSKVEYEAKVAEAAARGEEYQPTPRRKKNRQPSLQGAPNAGMLTPGMAEAGTAGEGYASSNTARTWKTAPEGAGSLASRPTGRNLEIEASPLAANQMQTDHMKQFKSTIPETQASEIQARENLLADMRENAERTGPDTVHSTMTLQHDSAPHSSFTSYQNPMRGPGTTREQQFL